jgi:tetratricopeptide (TPR) repeat protein
MENQRDQELIQRYIDRDVTPEEQTEVESRLNTEPELVKMHNDYKNLPAGIRYHAMTTRLEQLRALEKALPPVEIESAGARMLGRPMVWLAAAAVIALAVVSFVLFTGQSDAELYAKNFEPYPNVFEPTQRGENTTDKRATAFAMYEQGNYERAAALFTELLNEKKEPEILLLLGNSNMALNRMDEAKNNFLTLISDFDGLDEQARWFLSLCYLKSGDREKAKLIWEELGDPKITYSEKAKKLLDEVK